MIDITDFHTYPIKLREAKSSFDNLPNTVIEEIINSNYLNDYLEHEIFYQKYGDLHRLAKKITMALTEQQIKVYHCTRLPDIDTIKELGLIFPDERHFQYIIDSFHKHQVSEKIIKEITSNYQAREQSISFFYDKSEIQMYDRFSGLFGGEQLHYNLDTTKKDEYKHAIRIGKPVLIEFWIPIEWIQEVFREHLVKNLIMYWIKKDILNEDNVVFNLEGKTNHEIPPTQIRGIYYIEDTFDYAENW